MQQFVLRRPLTGIAVGVIGLATAATIATISDDPSYHIAALFIATGATIYGSVGVTGLLGNMREHRPYNDPTF